MPGFSSVKYNNLEALEAEFKKDADNIAAFMVGYIYMSCHLLVAFFVASL
jgi:glutamate-1-semialdehyde aminotransferase